VLIFINGKSTIGTKATAGIGIDSPIHHVIISAATANTFLAGKSKPNGLVVRNNTKSNMPSSNPNLSRKTGEVIFTFWLFVMEVHVSEIRIQNSGVRI
jgi:hypothetical protein